jgi:hypothetical protein
MTAPLIFQVPPAQHELASSYIARLARLHGFEPDDLWLKATSPIAPAARKRAVDPARLALLTGRPAEYLAGALPELRATPPDWRFFRHRPQTGCARCDARHPGGAVTRVLPHHRYVCLRHNHWIGPPDLDRPSFILDDLPEIARAQHRHNRLLRRHGWAAAYDAVLTGFLLCAALWNHPPRSPTDARHTWDLRATYLVPAGRESATFSASRMFAALYPEAVAVAELIASPAWRQHAHGTPEQHSKFNREIGTRLGMPDYTPGSPDAIAHWANIDSRYPPATPSKTLPDTRWNHSPNTPTHGENSLRRHSKSAHWFGMNREGGRAILYHQHIRPVIQRPHAPDMAEFRGALHVSQSPEGLLGHQYPPPEPAAEAGTYPP